MSRMKSRPPSAIAAVVRHCHDCRSDRPHCAVPPCAKSAPRGQACVRRAVLHVDVLCYMVRDIDARQRIPFARYDRTRRHPLRPLAHRLPAYRRRPHRAVQLALCARPRRQDAAADRGHRPRALDRGGDRRDPRRPDLARPRLGRRAVYQFSRAARHREVAEQLLAAGQAYRCYATPEELDRDAREGARRGPPQALRRPLARPRSGRGAARRQAGDPPQGAARPARP